MATPTKIILTLTLALTLVPAALLSPLRADMPSPRLPGPMSWLGTKEMAVGALDSALAVVGRDVSADTLLRLYKMGVINARLGNSAEALAALNAVNKGSVVLAPLAMVQIGDIAVGAKEDTRAVAAYSSALKASGLPAKYRHDIFGKVKLAVGRGGEMPPSQPWLDEYRGWDRAQRLFDAYGLEAICDTLIAEGRLGEADSLLEKHLPDLSKREACGVVDRVFKKRTADTALVTTKFLFSLASQSAAGCRNFATAERILGLARKRADFSSAVPARSAARLLGDIAYGREQWQQALDYYKKYDAAYGAESEVLMNAARACRNMGHSDQAQVWYDRHVERFPSHAKTQEILWLRAWNKEEAGQFKAAAAAYRNVFKSSGKRTEEAHLRHALCYYRLKEYDSTITYLEAFRKKYPLSSYLWAGVFWQGKSHMAKGRTVEAYKAWGDIARLDPTDYYAHRARQLMGADGDGAQSKGIFGEQFAAQVSEKEARAWLDKSSPSTRKVLSAKDSVDLKRGAALLTVANSEAADMFLYNFESNYSGNLQLQCDLASGYALAGNKALSFRVSRRIAWRIPMEYRDKAPLQVLSIFFPPFYSATISKYAERFGVDPLFVSSVMRQESIFDYQIVSPAGAIGLMQVMPATGKGIAQELKEPFTEDSLYSYEYNIRFGTYYLKKRSAQFDGDKVLVLCSYNAGAHNATKWRDKNKHLEPDLFVEDVGFFETRGYVKKVMGNYWTYKALSTAPGYEYEEWDGGRFEYRWITVYPDAVGVSAK